MKNVFVEVANPTTGKGVYNAFDDRADAKVWTDLLDFLGMPYTVYVRGEESFYTFLGRQQALGLEPIDPYAWRKHRRAV